MKSNAEFILGELRHEYDPVAAREYYLRTRILTGRAPAAAPPPSSGGGSQGPSAAEIAKQKLEGERKTKREELQVRLAELEVRVDKLNAAIKQAKVEAMRRAGGVSEDTLARMITSEVKNPGSSKGMKDEPDKAAKTDTGSEEKTAAQKREAAKAAKEKYEEENPESGNEDLQAKVDKTAERVEKLQKRIEAIGRIGA